MILSDRIGLLEKDKNFGAAGFQLQELRQECWNTQIILWEKGTAVNIGRKIVQFRIYLSFCTAVSSAAENHFWIADFFLSNILCWMTGWPDVAY